MCLRVCPKAAESTITLQTWHRDSPSQSRPPISDVNKDLTFKDKDKDKYQTLKAKAKDKD